MRDGIPPGKNDLPQSFEVGHENVPPLQSDEPRARSRLFISRTRVSIAVAIIEFHYVEDIYIASRNNFHFAKIMKDGKAVVVLVTKRTANVGTGCTSLRQAVPELEPVAAPHGPVIGCRADDTWKAGG